jgi:hypothetical protein
VPSTPSAAGGGYSEQNCSGSVHGGPRDGLVRGVWQYVGSAHCVAALTSCKLAREGLVHRTAWHGMGWHMAAPATLSTGKLHARLCSFFPARRAAVRCFRWQCLVHCVCLLLYVIVVARCASSCRPAPWWFPPAG